MLSIDKTIQTAVPSIANDDGKCPLAALEWYAGSNGELSFAVEAFQFDVDVDCTHNRIRRTQRTFTLHRLQERPSADHAIRTRCKYELSLSFPRLNFTSPNLSYQTRC